MVPEIRVPLVVKEQGGRWPAYFESARLLEHYPAPKVPCFSWSLIDEILTTVFCKMRISALAPPFIEGIFKCLGAPHRGHLLSARGPLLIEGILATNGFKMPSTPYPLLRTFLNGPGWPLFENILSSTFRKCQMR